MTAQLKCIYDAEATKYKFVQNMTMNHAISKLPDDILNMKMSDFIINCGRSDFNDKYNIPIELHDPTNELGLDDSESEDESEN